MTATLSSVLGENFASATAFNDFFDEADGRKIRKTWEIREQPVIGLPGESCKTNL
jgi:hypothetical protein